MKLKHITFSVPDIEKSITFYTELVNLTIQFRLSPPIGEICFLANDKGETMLEFIQFKQGAPFKSEGMVLAFKHDGDLKTLREKAISLGYIPSEIHSTGPMPTNFKITDPAGIMVEFCN
ncbi:catechol 2,3-dioxygenase-like lactoylglutathione lyase family enzyme [Breznakia sp. PF5-3]|uniref:VOC family protein n=1 Tax=unclassified Breznakia TaxID=2623764 RepID=UPI002406DAB4|nr:MULTISPECIES: VOC family protein [unclassified Breznakia]MDF9823978.1 catechol 2,3-dioxygenase-like lactoylglutathione lyase family enzyme [Breznakia sp. PM6-1]MDF9834777.1 catechol 2,3-dioxygenase-like lactoylglutathione lyase family enzyme [Breznakia sp. PF5-3]MDF9838044.1 catechol 2,3-dioxygenase-like lactoylglutathione lyase family enzyme [Breznakia sp. PFB2-8]MDF9860030.1 catechol 2,3-dioxygenase-like lactoylglutathione lyase family enzyme [Breznakia sp. PH5-24]